MILRRGILTAVAVLAGAQLGVLAWSTSASAAPSDYSVTGVDVSHYQGSINWSAVAGAGIDFAYAKATEGMSYTDPTYATNYSGARAAGLYFGAYGFGRPDQGNPSGQAGRLVDIGRYGPDGRSLPPMLDIEWPPAGDACYGLSASAMVSWVRGFVDRVRLRTGQRTVLYTNVNWWNMCTGSNATFGDETLFVARWGSTPGPLPPGWTRWSFWQYTSTGSVPGISGYVDRDVFNGSLADLAALAGNVSGVGAIVYGGVLRAFARGSDGALWQDYYSGGRWTWQKIGGQIVGGPSPVVYGDVLRVFARGSDGVLWQYYYTGGAWHTQQIGGQIIGGPSAVVYDSVLRVFARGTDNALWQSRWINGAWSWHDLGGLITTAPSAVVLGNSLRVFARGNDGALWQDTWSNSTWIWQEVGGLISSAPSAVVYNGVMQVFARGTDNALWQSYWILGVWSWHDLGGLISSAPGAVVHGTVLRVFARGSDGALWQDYRSGSTWTWQDLGGQIA